MRRGRRLLVTHDGRGGVGGSGDDGARRDDFCARIAIDYMMAARKGRTVEFELHERTGARMGPLTARYVFNGEM